MERVARWLVLAAFLLRILLLPLKLYHSTDFEVHRWPVYGLVLFFVFSVYECYCTCLGVERVYDMICVGQIIFGRVFSLRVF